MQRILALVCIATSIASAQVDSVFTHTEVFVGEILSYDSKYVYISNELYARKAIPSETVDSLKTDFGLVTPGMLKSAVRKITSSISQAPLHISDKKHQLTPLDTSTYFEASDQELVKIRKAMENNASATEWIAIILGINLAIAVISILIALNA